MKNSRKLMLLVALLVLSAALPLVGSASPSFQTGSYQSAFRVINIGSAVAQCSYQLYKDDGTAGFGTNLGNVNPGESAFVYTPAVSGIVAGTYAGTVNCTQPIAAVVNYSDTTGKKGDAYVATDKPATTLYSPSAYNNYFSFFSSIRLQNTTAAQQTVSIAYFAPGSATATTTKQHTLSANGALTVQQSSVTELLADVAYSAKITSDTGGAIAAIVQIYGSGDTGNQLYAFTAFSGGATSWYQPAIMSNYYTYNTATTIQNLGTAEADVDVTYSSGKVVNKKIPANSSVVVSDYTELKDVANRDSTLFSSVITSKGATPQPLIVTVNESTTATDRATTYEGFTAGGTKLAIPTMMKAYYAYNSSATCQNLGNGPATVSGTYVGMIDDATPLTVPARDLITNLAAGQSGLIYTPTDASLPDKFLGALTLTSNQPIACVVNSDQNLGVEGQTKQDTLGAFNGIKQQ